MPTISDIARDWGVKRQTVQAAVKKGCPTDSFESARFWRQANQKRAFRAPLKTTEEPVRGPQGPIVEDIGDDMLLGSKEAVRQSWRLLREALIEGKVQKIGAWISLYTRAIEANVKAESMVREEMERQRVLIRLVKLN
jgi:hypothetical protein